MSVAAAEVAAAADAGGTLLYYPLVLLTLKMVDVVAAAAAAAAVAPTRVQTGWCAAADADADAAAADDDDDDDDDPRRGESGHAPSRSLLRLPPHTTGVGLAPTAPDNLNGLVNATRRMLRCASFRPSNGSLRTQEQEEAEEPRGGTGVRTSDAPRQSLNRLTCGSGSRLGLRTGSNSLP